MKKIYLYSIVFALLCVLVVVYLEVLRPQMNDRTVAVTTPITIEQTELNFAYTYPSGLDAYSLVEPPIPPSTSDGLKKVSIIMQTSEYSEYFNNTNSVAVPPAVSIFVVEERKEADSTDSRIERLQKWAEANPQYTSYASRTSEVEPIELDGVKGLRYNTSGAYNQEVYLISHRGHLYAFVGQYEEEADEIKLMFSDLVSSVIFY